MSSSNKKAALVLTGGGARGAYQVGALQAVLDIANENGITKPFPILTGTSAGAINISYLAAHAGNMRGACRRLATMWSRIHTDSVYKSNPYAVLKNAGRLGWDLATGSFQKRTQARSLLNTSPLTKLIEKYLVFDQIQQNIDKGNLHAIAIKAINYSSGVSHTFFQGHKDIQEWNRTHRVGVRDTIELNHIMASTAIPLLFPPVQIGSSYYGDGSVRNYTPLSAAIKMGAEKIMVIGVRKPFDEDPEPGNEIKPSFARIISVILSAILMDSIEMDYERVLRINETLKVIKEGAQTPLVPVDINIIRPTKDISKIAVEESASLPKIIKYLVRGLGSENESASIISNILFEPTYIKKLMDMGYQDVLDRKEEMIDFLKR